jgi:hypothetical protein
MGSRPGLQGFSRLSHRPLGERTLRRRRRLTCRPCRQSSSFSSSTSKICLSSASPTSSGGGFFRSSTHWHVSRTWQAESRLRTDVGIGLSRWGLERRLREWPSLPAGWVPKAQRDDTRRATILQDASSVGGLPSLRDLLMVSPSVGATRESANEVLHSGPRARRDSTKQAVSLQHEETDPFISHLLRSLLRRMPNRVRGECSAPSHDSQGSP